MARLARVVAPNHPHHITQRGVRSMEIFRDDTDRENYLSLIKKHCRLSHVKVLSWCLMSNHVHFIVIPKQVDSLARAFGEAHKAYSRMVNKREGVTGYLFQGRFNSFVMDEEYTVCAARYIERNPVVAHMVQCAEDWPWSSARFHVGRCQHDVLVSDRTLLGLVNNWKDLLGQSIPENEQRILESHIATGRPLGADAFIEKLERLTGRELVLKKAGRPKGTRKKGKRK